MVRVRSALLDADVAGKCTGLILTAYAAGHSLGGTVWKLRSPTAGTIIMALDWNHNRERHLEGSALLTSSSSADAGGASGGGANVVGRPDILITDIQRGLLVNARRKERDAQLLDMVHRTLTGGHSVLIPVDTAARLFELLVLLDQHWAYSYSHMRFPLCLVSHVGQEVVERARAFIEWMSRDWAAQMLGEQEGGRGSRRRQKNAGVRPPLELPFLRYYSSVESFRSALAPSQAKVVLATPPSLTHGLSQHLLSEFLGDPDALVLLTGRGEPQSITRTLWDRWNAQQSDPSAWMHGRVGVPTSVGGHFAYEVRRKVRLAGEELRAHLEREKEANAQAAQERAQQARAQRQLEADEEQDEAASSSSDEDEGGELDPARLLASTRSVASERLAPDAPEETGVSYDIFLRGSASHTPAALGNVTNVAGDSAGQEYGAGVRFRMFPFIERKRKVDGYGEAIDTSRWLSRRRRVEEQMEAQLDAGAAATAARSAAKPAESQAKSRARAPEPPSKYTTETHTVPLRCHVAYIDMQGLHDGRALKTLIPQLQPRRLIMVNGDTRTREDLLASMAAVRSISEDVHAPTVGTTVRVGEITNAYSVRLGDALMKSLRWSRVDDYNVVHLHGVPDYGEDPQIPTLTNVPRREASDSQTHQAPSTLYIGDLKLSALKSVLLKRYGIRSDFAGEGVLVCDGKPAARGRGGGDEPRSRTITVKKEGAGRIVVEGNLSAGLQQVRQSVYDLYAQVHE